MKIKNILILLALLLAVCSGGLATRMLAQPGGPLQTVPIQPAQQIAAPASQKWEYEVVWQTSSPQTSGNIIASINRAAAQGFEVQEIVPVPPPRSPTSPPDIIVLLRRPRK